MGGTAAHNDQRQYALTYGQQERHDHRFSHRSPQAVVRLIDEVGQSHEPVQITGKRGNAVLLSEDDWRAIQETLHLVSIPGMRESILEGMAADASELSSKPGW